VNTPRATTTLHDVRDFLTARGAAPSPWATASEVIEALLALLRRRQHDDRFWEELERLLERLEDARVRPELIRGAEVLDGAEVGELLRDLRRALPASAGASGGGWIRGARAAKVLAALLLLGTAVGCQPYYGVVSDCSVDQAGLNPDEKVYCELVGMVEDSDVEDDVASDVLGCLPERSAVRRQQLVQQFRNLSDEELADALEDLAWSRECDFYEDAGDH